MEIEDIVLARRSLVRGVITRCVEIAEQFTEKDAALAKTVSSGPNRAGIDAGRHSLVLKKTFVVGQAVGFSITTRQVITDTKDIVGLYVFFNGKDITLQFISEHPPSMLWATPVLVEDGSAGGINGMTETPFWESEFEQAIRDHIPLVTEYIVSNGSLQSNGTSTTSAQRALAALDRALAADGGEEDLLLEADGLSGSSEMKNLAVSSMSDEQGVYHGVAVGTGLTDLARAFRNRARVVPDSNDRLHSFASALFAEAERQRHKTYRDADGNTSVDIYTSSRVDMGEHFDYSDILEVIHDMGKETSAMTVSEVLMRAKNVHYENRDAYQAEKKRIRDNPTPEPMTSSGKTLQEVIDEKKGGAPDSGHTPGTGSNTGSNANTGSSRPKPSPGRGKKK